MGALSGYVDWMIEHNHSANTRKQRLNFAKRLLREWGTFTVSGAHAVGWLNQFEGWTFQTYMTHMAAVYEYLLDIGQVEASPLERMHRPPVPPPTPRPLNNQQRDLVLTRSVGELVAICLLAYLAGLRVREVAKFRGEHINDSYIHVVGKGGKAADIPTHERLWQLAQEYPRRGFWFPSRRGPHLSADAITLRVTPYFRSLGIETGSLHRLRHTFAQDMSDNGVHPRTIQELMRHASLHTTMRYLEAGDERKRRAVSGLMLPTAA
jgi:integrase/recombinase XerD